MAEIDILIERIERRAAELNLSDRLVSMKATGKPDAIRYIRHRRAMPSSDRLYAIADTLGVSADYLLGRSDDPVAGAAYRQIVSEASTREDQDAKAHAAKELGLDATYRRRVPVYQTTLSERVVFPDHEGKPYEVQCFLRVSWVVNFVREPSFIPAKQLFGLQLLTTTLTPAFDPISIFIAHRDEEPGEAEYGLFVLEGTNNAFVAGVGEGSSEHYRLYHLYPEAVFDVPKNRISRSYRLLRMADYMFPNARMTRLEDVEPPA